MQAVGEGADLIHYLREALYNYVFNTEAAPLKIQYCVSIVVHERAHI